jgi:dTDP-4-dehydrorhamnose 3,5-epimerase
MTKILNSEISGLKIIEPSVFADSRGYFFESYKSSLFAENEIAGQIVQINQSFSTKNVIRGLHFQKSPHGQGKLIRCLSGEILDVAVDLRKNSATFGQHFAINLSGENKKMLFIPIGFAHGFSTLSREAEIQYLVFGSQYNKEAESGVKYNDENLKINWQVSNEIVSEKDLELPSFTDLKDFF